MKNGFVLLAAAVLMLSLAACGGGDGGAPPCAAPAFDVTGTWTITETTGDNTCGDPTGQLPSYNADFTQNGNAVTTGPFSGQICGNTMTISGTYPEDFGTTAETITLTVDAGNFSGSSTWTWTDGFDSCSGSSSYVGVKM